MRAKSGAKVLLFFQLCKFIAHNRAISLRKRLQFHIQPNSKRTNYFP